MIIEAKKEAERSVFFSPFLCTLKLYPNIHTQGGGGLVSRCVVPPYRSHTGHAAREPINVPLTTDYPENVQKKKEKGLM